MLRQTESSPKFTESILLGKPETVIGYNVKVLLSGIIPPVELVKDCALENRETKINQPVIKMKAAYFKLFIFMGYQK